MALVTLTGFPSSGKSRRAQQLRQWFESRVAPTMSICVISDDSLNIPRSSYSDDKLEKIARSTLLTNVTRNLNPKTIVIVDGLNYIKGFRYQMYCAAREARCKTLTIHVVALQEQCKGWDRHYGLDLVKALIDRYEEPKSCQRWDSPLQTVTWEDEWFTTTSNDTVELTLLGRQLIGYLTPPLVPLIDDDSVSTAATTTVKPRHAATLPTSATPTNALHTLDATCSLLMTTLMSTLAASPLPQPSGHFTIQLDLSHIDASNSSTETCTCSVQVHVPDSAAGRVNMARLQRLKRGFMSGWKAAGGARAGHATKGGGHETPQQVAMAFAEYLSLGLKN